MGRAVRTVLVLALLLPGSASAITFAPRVAIAPGHRLNAVACPAATFCLAVGGGGTAVSTAYPRGSWTAHRIGGGQALSDVAYASAHFCAVLGMKGRVLTSSHPSGGDWRTVRLAVPSHANLTAIACPSTHLCVIVDSRGGVFTSTTPANLVKANVACGSMSTCAAYTVDQFGNSVLYGYGQAIATAAPGPANPTDVACARTLCVVIDRRGGATVGS